MKTKTEGFQVHLAETHDPSGVRGINLQIADFVDHHRDCDARPRTLSSSSPPKPSSGLGWASLAAPGPTTDFPAITGHHLSERDGELVSDSDHSQDLKVLLHSGRPVSARGPAYA